MELIKAENIYQGSEIADDQTCELICQISDYFRNKITENERAAINKTNNALLLNNAEGMRNQIFKAADLLGIKLPSYSF